MHRIDSPHRSVDLFGAGKDGYTSGTPGSVHPTETTADHFNAFQEELCYVVEEMNYPLAKATNTQLLTALKTLGALGAAQSQWYPHTYAAALDLYSVAQDPVTKLIVAVGEKTGASPLILISTGGSIWTAKTEASNFNLYSVCHNGTNLWVAVGESTGTKSYIVTSPDGATWTEQTAGTPAGDYDLWGVCWDSKNSLFVAVGETMGAGGPWILTSPDGSNWTQRTMAAPVNETLHGVASNGLAGASALIVAVGGTDGTNSLIISSPDGINWTTKLNVASANNPYFTSVAHNGRTDASALWVASGIYGTSTSHNIYTSPDGAVWTNQTTPFGTQVQHICFGNGVWVGVGGSTGVCMVTSVDGVTWVRSYQKANYVLNGCGFFNGKWFAVGRDDGASPYILESPASVI
jgi:hypothetical protein